MPDPDAERNALNRISFVSSGVSIAEAENPNRPKRVLGFRDLVLFYVVTGISLGWIATRGRAQVPSLSGSAPGSASTSLSHFPCWNFLPAIPARRTLRLEQARFRRFLRLHVAWTYWTSNLPYFPAVLYFAASNILFMRQNVWTHLSNNATFYIVFSLLTLSVATLMNIVGLDVGKWLHNVGALAMWIPVGIVIVMGLIAWHRYGSATSFTLHSMTPSVHFNDIIFWSVLTFAFGGCETASFMGEEIKNPAALDSVRFIIRRHHRDAVLHPGNSLCPAGVALG